MASFTFNFKPLLLLQQTQLHLSSFSLSKNFNFYFSYDITPTKHQLKKLRVSAHSATSLSEDVAEANSGNDVDADFLLSGLSSFAVADDVSNNSHVRNHIRAQKPIEKRVILKDRHAAAKINGLNSKSRKQVASSSSSIKFKATNLVNLSEHKNNTNKMPDMQKEKRRSKKDKIDSPESTLRVGLDMCSKRGDVVGAIKLYELAKKEFIKLGQYHYAVLLYLCSSAATGIVQPAKSGSGTRSLSSGSESFIEFSDIQKTTKQIGVPPPTDFSDVQGDSSRRNSVNGSMEIYPESLDDLVRFLKQKADNSNRNDGGDDKSKSYGVQVSEEVKRAALRKGFEIYNEMRSENIPMNEATFTSVARMATAFGDGDMAFDMVKQMKEYGINPRLRSYGPALSIFCSNGDIDNAFKVESHMLEHGVYPEEPELEALLKVSIDAGKSEKVYNVLHKLRTSVRQVSSSTAELIERWFTSKTASRVGKRKWDQNLIIEAMKNGGGGWHGKGWLGKGKWTVSRSPVDSDGLCKCCGKKLVTIDLDPVETENFAKSVASIAAEREKDSSFQKFQKWLDYYGPFEAVVDAANVGLYSQRSFKPSKVNAVVNGIRQMLHCRKWPLIVLHNRRINGGKMEEPFNKALIEKWRTADAIYATPTGSNDDWYWLYAAIKCGCLLVTNDEMRDHLFQLFGNDFFPKWKERHQVRFSFTETGPTFRMPPPCSVVIQETEEGQWHIPIVSESENEDERIWLCCSRSNSSSSSHHQKQESEIPQTKKKTREARIGVETVFGESGKRNHSKNITLLTQLETAEELGDCAIDFQI
ncbi:hypothetical protein ABFX02_10G109000 [Erythranthe guttata]